MAHRRDCRGGVSVWVGGWRGLGGTRECGTNRETFSKQPSQAGLAVNCDRGEPG